MKKLLIFFIASLFLIQLANAAFCEDRLDNNSNCLMVSSTLNCQSYTYDIIAENKTIIGNNQSLILLNQSIYYFNFTNTIGDYIIRFCDNTTKQIIVTETYDKKLDNEKKERMNIAIVLMLSILIIVFSYFAINSKNIFKREELNKSFMFFFFFITLGLGIIGIQLIKEMAEVGSASSGINNLIVASYRAVFWTMMSCLFIIFIIALYYFLNYLKDIAGGFRKPKRLKYI